MHRNGRLGLVGSRPETLGRQLADSGLYVIRRDNRDTKFSTSYPRTPRRTQRGAGGGHCGDPGRYGIERAHAQKQPSTVSVNVRARLGAPNCGH